MRRKIEITEDGVAAKGDTGLNDTGLNKDITMDTDINTELNADGAAEQSAAGNGAEGHHSTTEAAAQQSAPPPHASTVPEDTVAYIVALQADLEEARIRAEDAEKRLIYAQAEFQNVLRRRDEQYRGDQKFANSELIKSMLPVLDNFERALKAADQARSFEALIGGVTGTHKQLVTLLEKAGVTPIDALGKEFNPLFHEAIGHAEESEYPANTVAEELQRGYIMHDRVLRPTLVKVAGG